MNERGEYVDRVKRRGRGGRRGYGQGRTRRGRKDKRF